MSGDRSGDTSDDVSGEGQWLTYTELAERRGIDRASAVRLAIRRHWRRQKSNTGREVRVLVPPMTPCSDGNKDRGHANQDTKTRPTFYQQLFSRDCGFATVGAVGTARRPARSADRDRARQGHRHRGEGGVGTSEAQATELRGQIEALNTELDATRADLEAEIGAARRVERAAVQAADGLRQADEARRALTRWARLRAAWRGR